MSAHGPQLLSLYECWMNLTKETYDPEEEDKV